MPKLLLKVVEILKIEFELYWDGTSSVGGGSHEKKMWSGKESNLAKNKGASLFKKFFKKHIFRSNCIPFEKKKKKKLEFSSRTSKNMKNHKNEENDKFTKIFCDF